MFNNLDILSILKLGFHGVAVVMLYMGFRLLKSLLRETPKDNESVIFELKCKTMKFFLIIALAFLIVGPTLQIISRVTTRTNELHLVFHPRDISESNWPEVNLKSYKLNLYKGKRKFFVSDQDTLNISLKRLINYHKKMISKINKISLLRNRNSSESIGDGSDD